MKMFAFNMEEGLIVHANIKDAKETASKIITWLNL